MEISASRFSGLVDERFQPSERRVPLVGDLIEASARQLEPSWLQLPDPLAPAAAVLREPGIGERVEVFGDRLARHAGALAEPRDRERAADAESRDEPEACCVYEHGEH